MTGVAARFAVDLQKEADATAAVTIVVTPAALFPALALRDGESSDRKTLIHLLEMTLKYLKARETEVA